MKFLKPFIFIVFCLGLYVSCGGDSTPVPNAVSSPVAASLLFPENNTECNEGEIITNTESRVVFRWNASENTDSYTVNLKNLNSGNIQNLDATQNELAIAILRGMPYEWSVISKARGTIDVAESDSWRFYNTGVPVESHPPFPANVISPKMGSQVNAGSITLSWEGGDVDNDILSYEIIMNNNSPPTASLGEVSSNFLNISVSSSNVYYWKVITKDQKGNKSDSSIFQFRVN